MAGRNVPLGLPDEVAACLFDLDGVLTSTAVLHRVAWKSTFDEFLRQRGAADDELFTESDYLNYVDGRPRYDGVRAFLASRDITLPEGTPDDPPSRATVQGLGNRKNEALGQVIAERGITPYEGSTRYLTAVRDAGLAIGVVTSSANAVTVLDVSDLAQFVQARVDGLVIAERGLRGKPAPDSFLAAAAMLDTPPERAAVFEDALAGVSAGRDGGFGWVVGVNRTGQHAAADALREHGADVVVDDLAELLPEGAS